MAKRNLTVCLQDTLEKYPYLEAVRIGKDIYSYSGFFNRVHQLAAAIQVNDPNPGIRLGGILAYRSLYAYCAELAFLFAGKGFVPLNPKFPLERNLSILDLSGVKTLIVDHRCEDVAAGLLAKTRGRMVIFLPEHASLPEWAIALPSHRFICSEEITVCKANFHGLESNPEDIAYLLFTSGSTGIPKGVMITHENVCSYLDSVRKRYGPGPGDSFSQFFEMTFDLSIHDIMLSLTSGARLCPVREMNLIGIREFVQDNTLTFWFSVPSTVGLMKKYGLLKPEAFQSLRWSLFCGEPLPQDYVTLWQAAAPNSKVENIYGPTETTIAITAYSWQPGVSDKYCHNGIVPVGFPLEGQAAAVVDEKLRFVPPGIEGELCLSGSQVSPGYWSNEPQTAKSFVTLSDSRRWYRTGDRVRFTEESGYLFLGRIDRQIKIRGFRAEIPEIEHTLRQVITRGLVAVIGWPVGASGADGVIAFTDAKEIDHEAALSYCQQRLPAYMVPTEIIHLPEMPFNAAGKVDYGRLKQIREGMG